MNVTENIRAGETFNESASGGIRVTRVFDVTGIGTPQQSALYRAGLDGRVPKLGNSHPYIPDITVLERDIQPMGAGTARITTHYGISQSDSTYQVGQVVDIRFDGGTREETTTRDRFGEYIQTIYGAHVITRQVPVTTCEIDRVESTLPAVSADQFRRRVNSSAWSGYEARTWLITAVRSRRIQSTGNYMVTYAMVYEEKTWDHVLETFEYEYVTAGGYTSGFILENDRQVVKSVKAVTKRYELYDSVDFNRLGFRIR